MANCRGPADHIVSGNLRLTGSKAQHVSGEATFCAEDDYR